MSAKCGTFDESLISDEFIGRMMNRLGALARDTSERLASLRRVPTRESTECEADLSLHLVTRCKSGDEAAMEALIKRYQPRVAGFVFACVGDGQAVEDLCQTIFLKVIATLRRLEEEEKFEAWLFRIARNTCFDHLRKRRLRRIFVPWEPAHDAIPIAEQSADCRSLDTFRRALMKLPKRHRELIALLQDDQLSYEQLAAITNSSVSAVRSRLFRARCQLRKIIRDEN